MELLLLQLLLLFLLFLLPSLYILFILISRIKIGVLCLNYLINNSPAAINLYLVLVVIYQLALNSLTRIHYIG